jgi:hypothetical protein
MVLHAARWTESCSSHRPAPQEARFEESGGPEPFVDAYGRHVGIVLYEASNGRVSWPYLHSKFLRQVPACWDRIPIVNMHTLARLEHSIMRSAIQNVTKWHLQSSFCIDARFANEGRFTQ